MSGDILMTVVERENTGQFDAYVDGRLLLTSKQPFLDASKELIAQGYDPQDRLVMRRPDREQVDQAAPLYIAAQLKLKGRLKFRRRH